MKRLLLGTLVSATALVAAGSMGACGGSGGSGAGGGGNGGSPPAATYAEVQAVFDHYCTNCHDAAKQGLPYYPSLSLVAADSYDALVGKPADETCGGTRVVAGSPDTSYLMAKLGDGDPCSGGHMPRPFEIGPSTSLPSQDLETIRSWIAAGAKK
jgi:hypothetical protein